ncbi:hypothetical protein SteCoe_2108 [Stentor coeruleus]|uniref:RING-type domain-containing protein n=1 Tax=Stentor coeruleus TaxID=5963 RepID=A0A1R2D065_9CILI|nr:hypothetical protein SteCoe_2108 [Stentor coeruleus]
MSEEFKSTKQKKINFEIVKQPIPDNSPDIDDLSSYELLPLSYEVQIEQIKSSIRRDQKVIFIQCIEDLQHQSYENALHITTLYEERRRLIKDYQKIRYNQYKRQIDTAISMSLQDFSGHARGHPRNGESIDLETFNGDQLDNMTYEDILKLEEKIGSVNVGLTELEISSIPMTNLEKPDTCSICLNQGTHGKVLLCSHFFHGECIDRWLQTRKQCPLCMSECIL